MAHSISASVAPDLGDNQARCTAFYAAHLKMTTKKMDIALDVNPTE